MDRFLSIIEDGNEGIVILDSEGVIDYVNAAAEFLLGIQRERLRGELFGIPLVANHKPTEVNVISSDGLVRTVKLSVEPMPTPGSNETLLRLEDITHFRQDVREAQEQVSRRDTFLAMLSHELRNPLAGIRNAVEVLRRNGLPQEPRRDAFGVLDRQFDHLSRILDDLLDITRVSRGVIELEKECIDLCASVRDALDAVSEKAQEKKHRIDVILPNGAMYVLGDSTRLEQVVVNLLTNAVKFTPSGGSIRLELESEGDLARLTVRDNGPGIPEELVGRLFEPFVQGNQTLDRSQGGLGIGLALARSIVELHDGRLEVENNEPQQGCTFTVELRLSASPETSESIQLEIASNSLDILLIEDSPDARRMLKILLELEGHRVLEAIDGRTGLDMICQSQPDVALVDLGLPELSGLEVAQAARADPRAENTQLIALTGYGMPKDHDATRRAGFVAHLTKPLRYPELAEILTALEGERKTKSSAVGTDVSPTAREE